MEERLLSALLPSRASSWHKGRLEEPLPSFSPYGHIYSSGLSFPLTDTFILLKEMENIPPALSFPLTGIFYSPRGEWKSISLTGTSVSPRRGIRRARSSLRGTFIPGAGKGRGLYLFYSPHTEGRAVPAAAARARAPGASPAAVWGAAPPLLLAPPSASGGGGIPDCGRRDPLRSRPPGRESGRQAGREGGRGRARGASYAARLRWLRRGGPAVREDEGGERSCCRGRGGGAAGEQLGRGRGALRERRGESGA